MRTNDLVSALETLVAQSSATDVLTAFERMCDEKAAHLKHNWRDSATALRWHRLGRAIGKVANNASDLDL